MTNSVSNSYLHTDTGKCSVETREGSFLGFMPDVVVPLSDSSVSSMECSVESSQSEIDSAEETEYVEQDVSLPETLLSRPVPSEDRTINGDDEIERPIIVSSVAKSCVMTATKLMPFKVQDDQVIVADKTSVNDQCGVDSTIHFHVPQTCNNKCHVLSFSLSDNKRNGGNCTSLQLLLKSTKEQRSVDQTAVLFLCLLGQLVALGQSLFLTLVHFFLFTNKFIRERDISSLGIIADSDSSVSKKNASLEDAFLSRTSMISDPSGLYSDTNQDADKKSENFLDDTRSANHDDSVCDHEVTQYPQVNSDLTSVKSCCEPKTIELADNVKAVSLDVQRTSSKFDFTMMDHKNFQPDHEDQRLNTAMAGQLHRNSESLEQEHHVTAVCEGDMPFSLQCTIMEQDRLKENHEDALLDATVDTTLSQKDMTGDRHLNFNVMEPDSSDPTDASPYAHRNEFGERIEAVDSRCHHVGLTVPADGHDQIHSTDSDMSVSDVKPVPLDLTACVVWKGRSENPSKDSLLVGKLFCYEKIGFNSFAVCPTPAVSQAT